MKKILFLFFFSSVFFFANAQQKKDSTFAKKHFISVTASGGMGWREYYYPVNTWLLPDGAPQKGERPGLAYAFALNYGYTKKRWTHTFGIAYDHVTYQNDKAGRYVFVGGNTPNFLVNYKYSFIHQFLSFSYSFNYSFGKKQKWTAGMNFKAGRLFQYNETLVSSDNTPSYLAFNMNHDLEKNITAWAGLFIGRKLLETNKLRFFVELHVNISSPVGYNTVPLNYYDPNSPSPGSPYSPTMIRKYNESQPHYLLTSFLQFNLHYKL